jgi:bifunctional ADP-heptose synthase (sugar kinase/adenylyltransferase)
MNRVRRIPHATRILVVGDVMLDRYWFGEVSRISPEAPVPVVKVERTEERPGGAANVARNCAALGAQGDAAVGGRCRRGRQESWPGCWARTPASNAACTRMPRLSTTVKLRVVGRQQQLLRIDFENSPEPRGPAGQAGGFRAPADRLRRGDPLRLRQGRPGPYHPHDYPGPRRRQAVLVDPKGEDYARYAGATLLTPNRAELREVVGRWKDEAELARKARRLRNELKLDACW